MVSLDINSEYLDQFSGDDEMGIFRSFLAGGPVAATESSEAVPELIGAISNDDPARAKVLLEDFAAKNPDSNSHFIYKDRSEEHTSELQSH